MTMKRVVARKTNKNMNGVAKELRKLHRAGITVITVLFATVAFSAIFTVPGGDNNGTTVMITVVRGEIKSERRVVEVINKLIWLASVCTSVAFIASSYIVVGHPHRWSAVFVTVVDGVIMAGVLGTMTYYMMKSKRSGKVRKREVFEEQNQLATSLGLF